MQATSSWKTTIAGTVAAIGTLLAGMPDSGQPAWLKIVGLVLAILGTLGVGILAKDHSASTNPLDLDPATAASVKTEVEALVAAVVAAKAKINTPAPPAPPAPPPGV